MPCLSPADILLALSTHAKVAGGLPCDVQAVFSAAAALRAAASTGDAVSPRELQPTLKEEIMTHACYCVTEHNAQLEQIDCPTPDPNGAEVLIRMTAAGVCHSDIHLWEGVYDLGSGKKLTLKDRGITLPLTMGHEICGEVVKIGPDANSVKVGTSCIVFPWLGCGDCPTCKRGEENLCTVKTRSLGVFMPGGYAEYVLVPHERYCIDLGELDPVASAPLACSGVTTYSGLKKFGVKIKEEPVVIMGAGGLGHMALTVLRAMGGKGAIIVDIDEAKRAAAVEAGAIAAVDGAASDAAQQIIKATGGGAACVLDLVGSSPTINLGIASIKKGGEIVVVGLYGGELKLPLVYFPLRGMGIRGSYVGNLPELLELVALAQKGTLKPIKVTPRKLHEASAALMDLRAGKVVGRVVLVP
jgi:D-arabinose 1-dehydrogenase-like Zn-dependent alcohol dehydrogenase